MVIIVHCFTRTWLRYVRVFAITNPSVVCRLSVCNVGSPYSGDKHFGNISSPLCTLAILWPPCIILRRSSQGNPAVGGGGGVKRKRDSKIERWWIYRRLYLINGARYALGYNLWLIWNDTWGIHWCNFQWPWPIRNPHFKVMVLRSG